MEYNYLQHSITEFVDNHNLGGFTQSIAEETVSGNNEVTGVVVDGLSGDGKKIITRQVAAKVFDHLGVVDQYEFGFGDLWRRAVSRGIITAPQGKVPKSQYEVVAFQNLVLTMVGLQVLRRKKPTIIYYRSVSKTATSDEEGNIKGVDRSFSASTYLARRSKSFWIDASSDYDVVKLALSQRDKKESAKIDPNSLLERSKLVIDSDPSEFLMDLDTGGGWANRLQQEVAMKRIIYWAIENGQIYTIPIGTFYSFKEFNSHYRGQDLVDLYRRADIGPFFVKRVLGLSYIPPKVVFVEGHMIDGEIHMDYRKVKRMIPAVLREVQRPKFRGYRAMLQAARIID